MSRRWVWCAALCLIAFAGFIAMKPRLEVGDSAAVLEQAKGNPPFPVGLENVCKNQFSPNEQRHSLGLKLSPKMVFKLGEWSLDRECVLWAGISFAGLKFGLNERKPLNLARFDELVGNAHPDSIGGGLAKVAELYREQPAGIERVLFSFSDRFFDEDVGARLSRCVRFSNSNRVPSCLSRFFSFLHGILGGGQCCPKQGYGPDAYSRSHNAQESHQPLRGSVAPTWVKEIAPGMAIRIPAFGIVFIAIMWGAGKFSGADWGQSAWRFYGGLIGGLLLSGLMGFLILGWPFLRHYGVLP
jgi:hypothetical protein